VLPHIIGQAATKMVLEDVEYYREKYLETNSLRHKLAIDLRNQTNLQVHEGVANYLLFKLLPEAEDASALSKKCRQHGLFIRDISLTAPCLGAKTLRIAVKDAATNKKCCIFFVEPYNYLHNMVMHKINNSPSKK
jgi:histidinol-phosphate/aromatic aminotransferase/cobyric acid decarboxylase-like protein